MTNRETTQQARDSERRRSRADDRRGDVKPTDNPVPRSPEPEEESVRQGEEKLQRVKPY